MRAIDFYAGIGGWSLGLKMAGLSVTDSYEWWKPAIATHENNLGSMVHECDIRALDVKALPSDVDVVVGSPPCTQFSFSNRGGSGDIADGLVDIEKFLEAVSFLKPTFWAMENVPRVKAILDDQLQGRGRLRRFAKLGIESMVIDISEFGLPQKRRRCIAGNFDFELLLSYRAKLQRTTLGAVLSALSGSRAVVDPIYEIEVARSALTEQEVESPLNAEEERMNRESKTFHPVYNNMPFPDPTTAPVRTITATCTRVSRESIVVVAPEDSRKLRRLTVRERASLQGFPITYQFFGKTYSQKLKMIGNAVPPLMPFYIAQAMLGTKASALVEPRSAVKAFNPTLARPPRTTPDDEGATFPPTRAFRAAIPNLRFKSGVRFELANQQGSKKQLNWQVRFYFGNSKDIRECELGKELLKKAQRALGASQWRSVDKTLASISDFVGDLEAQTLQDIWSHRAVGVHPFTLVDRLGVAAQHLASSLEGADVDTVGEFVLRALNLLEVDEDGEADKGGGARKVRRLALPILTGFLVGAAFNEAFGKGRQGKSKRTKGERIAA